MTYSRLQHDLGVVDPNSSTNVVGLVCARDDANKILYQEFDEEYLAQQFFTGTPSYVNTPPQRRLPMQFSDFRSGFGLDIFSSELSKRYFSSYGADMRFKDRATLSYGATSIAMPTPHTASGWNLAVNHSDSGAVWSDEASAYDNNTATYAYVTLINGGWTDYIELHIPAISCSQIRYWWSESVVNAVTDLEIDVYYNGAWNTVVSNDSQGLGAYATASLGATYTVYAARLRFYGQTTDQGRLNELQFYATSATIGGTVGKGKTFNDVEYIPIANTLYKLNATGNGFTLVEAFPNAITSLEPMIISGTDYLFIALGLADAYWYMVAAETCTESTATVNTFQFFQTVYTTALTMYGNDSNSTIRSTTNPLNGGTAWSGQTQVDSDLYDITGLKSKSGALYIAKENMPYYLSAAGAVQQDLAPELEALIATTSGKNGDIWLDKWYYPAGDQALLEIGDSNTWRTPAEFCSNQSDFNGKVSAVTHDDRWLWGLLNNTTKVEVICGRLEDIDGTTSWVWHTYRELTMGNCNTAWVSTVYQKRLWIASATAGEALQYIPLPTGYGNLEADANRSFATTGYFETPFLHGDFKADTKGWIKVTAVLGHSYDADIYWQIQYKKLQDSSYTNIGNLVGTSTNRTHTLYLPVDSSSNKPSSVMMRFKLIGVTDDTAKTPVLNSLVAEAVLYPPNGASKVIACTVKDIKTMVTSKGGEPEKGSQPRIKEVIDNAVAATYPVTIYDIEGTSRTVKFMSLPSGTPRRYPVRKVKDEIEWFYNLLLQEITTS